MFRFVCVMALLIVGQCSSAEVLPESGANVEVGDDQSIAVGQIPGCYGSSTWSLSPPSDDWTFEEGLQDLGPMSGIGSWKYGDGQVDLYAPGRVTGQLDGLEFSSLPDDRERFLISYATARADDGSLVLAKDVALEEIPDDVPHWCPLEIRLRNLSCEEEDEFLNGMRIHPDM